MSKERSFKQELVGLLGKPVAANPTQPMIEQCFRHHQLDWRYLTIEVEPRNLGDAVRGMRAMGFRGGNCATPHKVAVIEHLDRLTESAKLIGAVNCIVRQGDELVGDNTDGKAVLRSLREIADPAGKRVVIFGAGAAARAIGFELAGAGVARIEILNRTAASGRELSDLLTAQTDTDAEFVPLQADYDVPAGTDFVINATAVGLYPDIAGRLPLNVEALTPETVVADIVFNPPKTRLLLDAITQGCRVIDGMQIMARQGAINFELWTGVEPGVEMMQAVLQETLSG